MSKRVINIFLTALILGILGIAYILNQPRLEKYDGWYMCDGYSQEEYCPDILNHINNAREVRGLGKLSYSPSIANGAEMRAEELSINKQQSHDGLNEAIDKAGLPPGNYGENFAIFFEGNNNRIVEAWIASPKHAEIMFDPSYTMAGIGRFEDYVVLWLGK